MAEPVFITGMGICSPIGNNLPEVIAALAEGRSGIDSIRSFDCSSLVMKHAGEVKEIPNTERFPSALYRIWDRGTRMAMHAAHEAIAHADLRVREFEASRIGVCVGTSGSGQYQNARFNLDRTLPIDPELVFYLSRNSPHFQSSQIAAQFNIKGPNLAIGAATAGGGIALATALAWLKGDRVDAVLVGGSESFSLLNVLGFDQLGLSLPEPCTPFSGQPGMTFGEGAGFVVLERESSVQRRGARALAKLSSVAIRADGFDPILFHPSGDGQSRAMRAALQDAGLTPGDIDWIRASGTGGRDQDLAETLAIKSVFTTPPPVSSIEPYVGHANGAGPAIGLVAAVLCLQHQLIPATLNYGEPRQGCNLDYVIEGTRRVELRNILCNTVAFGGTNCAVILQAIQHPALPKSIQERDSMHSINCALDEKQSVANRASEYDEIVITGFGIVSSIGCGNYEIMQRLQTTSSFLRSDSSLSDTEFAGRELGFVSEFNSKKFCPTISLRGVENLTQYAAGAVSIALADAAWRRSSSDPNRMGLVSATARTSGTVFARLFTELQTNGFRPLVGRLMLRNGRFMVASQLANWFELRGYSSTISLGNGCGLHAIVAAYDQLRSDPSLDSIVVVACDELSKHSLQMMQCGGLLAPSTSDWALYSSRSKGFIPAEGAVAIVVERLASAKCRNAKVLARVSGAGSTFDGLPGAVCADERPRPSWDSLAIDGAQWSDSCRIACEPSNVAYDQLDLIMGNGCGVWDWDQKEINGQTELFGNRERIQCVNEKTGFGESTSGLLNMAAGVFQLQSGATSVPFDSLKSRSDNVKELAISETKNKHLLVTASTEHGHNAAVLLTVPTCGA